MAKNKTPPPKSNFEQVNKMMMPLEKNPDDKTTEMRNGGGLIGICMTQRRLRDESKRKKVALLEKIKK